MPEQETSQYTYAISQDVSCRRCGTRGAKKNITIQAILGIDRPVAIAPLHSLTSRTGRWRFAAVAAPDNYREYPEYPLGDILCPHCGANLQEAVMRETHLIRNSLQTASWGDIPAMSVSAWDNVLADIVRDINRRRSRANAGRNAPEALFSPGELFVNGVRFELNVEEGSQETIHGYPISGSQFAFVKKHHRRFRISGSHGIECEHCDRLVFIGSASASAETLCPHCGEEITPTKRNSIIL